TGSTEIEQMILFRDWLRSHDDERDAYLAVKRDLAERTWRHVQHYADAKTAIVQQILARATAERQRSPAQQPSALTSDKGSKVN
ncbi:MAG: GrpB family protein, partial [Actinobacteria bacterium]|nr:GrpB family protein [Actinomycetota bacterium]